MKNKGKRYLAVIAFTLGLAACGKTPEPAESRLRAVIDQMQQAAESRQVGRLMAHVSEQYRDESGRDKKALGQLARFYFMRHRQPHILVRIKGIQWLKPDRSQARVHLLAATAGQLVDDPGLLSSIRADLLQFDVVFVDSDDGFMLHSARWQRAWPEDFLP